MRLIDAGKLKFVPALIAPTLVGEEPHWETIILKDRIDTASTIDAIPVSWIEERIKNANTAGQTLIARMWQELIDGYRREHERSYQQTEGYCCD